MAVSRKMEREMLREKFLSAIRGLFTGEFQRITDGMVYDEEALMVKSNEIAIPVVGCEGNEDWIVVTVKVPTGANKGLEPYDGYEMAEDYEMKLKEKERKAKEKAIAKEKKIKRDKELREKKKKEEEK